VAPIPGTRLSALIFGVASESDVPSVIGGSVIGDGEIIGGRLIGILSIEDGFVQSLSGGFDYKSFEEVADDIPTRVTYFPITLDYFGSVTTEDAETNFGTGLVFSLRQPASSDRRFDEKRFGARRNFAYVTGELSRLQKLPEDIQVYGRFRTQLAQQPLISNEQFSLGGVDSVRGYLEGEELGDYGVAFQSEVRSPSLGPLVAQDLNELRFYGFFDIGQAGIVDPLPEQEQTFFLNSFGMGARIKAFESIQGSVDIAVARTGASNTDAGDVRTHFRVSGEF
jgi:hemolysin activation/secretion protein